MSHYNLSKDEIIISGDFNFHVNKPNDPDAKRFIDILTTFNLVQHITQSTHILGNTLDLLITKSPSTLTDHKVDFQISDHYTILFDLNIGKTECPKKILNFRKLKAINIDEFKKDIKQLSDNSAIIDSLSDLVDFYNVELNRILDNHAPEQCHLVALRKPTPWTSQDIKPEKQERRRLERKWRRTHLQVDYDAYKAQRNRVNAILNTFRVKYYSDLIRKNANNPRALFKLINRALHRKQESPLPPHSSEVDLANSFKEKIQSIRNYLDSQISNNDVSAWHDQPCFNTLFPELNL